MSMVTFIFKGIFNPRIRGAPVIRYNGTSFTAIPSKPLAIHRYWAFFTIFMDSDF